MNDRDTAGAAAFSFPRVYGQMSGAVSSEAHRLFYLNFYVPLTVSAASLAVSTFCTGFYARHIALIFALGSSLLAPYLVEDIFSITLSIFSAFLVVTAAVFPPPKNLILAAGSLALFLLSLRHTPLWGPFPDDLALDFSPPDAAVVVPAMVTLLIPPFFMAALSFVTDSNILHRAAIAHLNRVNTQTLLFNRRLQDLAKTRGEDAVKADRLRFTRDLHDGCGYAFTNIIAVTDAAVSCGDLETGAAQEIFQRIRSLAQTGLRETREILHLIREITEPDSKNIDSITEVKRIFEEVTGIAVTLDWGNICRDYGPEVNTALARILQEAFTNAVRHGQATKIHIHLWELPGALTMTVTDNGLGASTVVKGIGLAGMEERLETMGGTLAVSNPADGGFRLHIAIININIPAINLNIPNLNLPNQNIPPREAHRHG